MRLRGLECEILIREMSQAIARTPNAVEVTRLPAGLRDRGRRVAAPLGDGVITVEGRPR